jgi:hypothetical protein
MPPMKGVATAIEGDRPRRDPPHASLRPAIQTEVAIVAMRFVDPGPRRPLTGVMPSPGIGAHAVPARGVITLTL